MVRPEQSRFPSYLGPLDLQRTPLLRTDVLVIGGGVAGAAAALEAAADGASVLLVSKSEFHETNTAWAQGGIAASLTDTDSPDLHIEDTLSVGAGLANAEAARAIVPQSEDALQWLIDAGARFDQDPDGGLQLSREGGHSVGRVVHANGDATGAEIQRTVVRALGAHPQVTCKVGACVRDLLVNDGRCVGATLRDAEGVELAVEAGAVVLAAGGCGQIFRETTNPNGATGDAVALAFRAGAEMTDLEFVQFHPTTLYIAGAARFLISEVIRGAGATLRDRDGNRFMEDAHPMAELAPRDVVSRAILDRMVATGDTHVYLDLSTVRGNPHRQFPSISRICDGFDIDIAKDPIPVRPGAHYSIGGAVTDLEGRTTVPGLFAVGEASGTGLHGANRLASNSLLEGAVMGRVAGRIAATEATSGVPSRLPRSIPAPARPDNAPRIEHDDLLYSLKSLMWRQVGLQRNAEGMREAAERIAFWHHYLMRAALEKRRSWELVNMLTTSALMTQSALVREESRGTHFRSDFPQRDDAHWCRRIHLVREDDGSIGTRLGEPFAPSDQIATAEGS